MSTPSVQLLRPKNLKLFSVSSLSLSPASTALTNPVGSYKYIEPDPHPTCTAATLSPAPSSCPIVPTSPVPWLLSFCLPGSVLHTAPECCFQTQVGVAIPLSKSSNPASLPRNKNQTPTRRPSLSPVESVTPFPLLSPSPPPHQCSCGSQLPWCLLLSLPESSAP